MAETLIRIAAPVAAPVTLAEAKDFLAIEADEGVHDGVLAGLIAAAVARLDGASGLLGRSLITQTWRLVLDHLPAEIVLPLPPLQRVEAIRFGSAADGASRVLAPDEYRVLGLGGDGRASVRPAAGKGWPATSGTQPAVEVDFVAGYGDAPDDVPAAIRTAILMDVATLFDHRENVSALGLAEMPHGAAELLAPYRLWSF